MTEERKQELRELLSEATKKENLKIRYEHGQGMIYRYEVFLPVDEYRKYLQDRWAFYSKEPSWFFFNVKPHIVSETTKSKLLDFIREELAPFIEENSVYVASYAIEGSHVDRFRIEDIRSGGLSLEICINHLLKIAIACGAEEAVSVFDRYSCTEGSQGYFQSVASLEGIKLEADIQVYRGARLVTVPDIASGPIPASLLRHMPSFLHIRESEFSARGKRLLMIDRPAFFKFHKPSQESFDEETRIDDLPFHFELDGEQFTNPQAVRSFQNLFCQALSLACNSAVQISGTGWLFAEEKSFHPCNGGVSLSRSPGPFGDPIEVGEAQIEEAKGLYEKLVILDSAVREKLRIPFDRWIQSKVSRDPVDKMIDLGIAFEALYLSDIPEPTELSFRLRLHAAWHLGESEEDRKGLMKEFSEIYNWRSKVVHTGKLPNKTKKTPFTHKEVQQFIENAQDRCRESILKILEDGKFPDWNSLILGGEEEQAGS